MRFSLSILTIIPLRIYSLSDLYYLVKYLPAYALPAGRPSMIDVNAFDEEDDAESPGPLTSPWSISAAPPTPGKRPSVTIPPMSSVLRERNGPASPRILPPPVSTGSPGQRGSYLSSVFQSRSNRVSREKERIILPRDEESLLMPAYMPPKYSIFDLFPFSLLGRFLTHQGKEVKGKKSARIRAKLRNQTISHNLPLELSLYLVRLPHF